MSNSTNSLQNISNKKELSQHLNTLRSSKLNFNIGILNTDRSLFDNLDNKDLYENNENEIFFSFEKPKSEMKSDRLVKNISSAKKNKDIPRLALQDISAKLNENKLNEKENQQIDKLIHEYEH